MVSANVLCPDIVCKPMPGSPPLFLFFVGVRGEPGKEANKTCREDERERARRALIKIFMRLISVFIADVGHHETHKC